MSLRPSSKQLQSTPVIQAFNAVMSEIETLSQKTVHEVTTLIAERHREAQQKLDAFRQKYPSIYATDIKLHSIAPIYCQFYWIPLLAFYLTIGNTSNKIPITLDSKRLLRTARFNDLQYATAILLGAVDHFSLLRMNMYVARSRFSALLKKVISLVVTASNSKPDTTNPDPGTQSTP